MAASTAALGCICTSAEIASIICKLAPDDSVCRVADGHGGHQCAAWLANNLHRVVIDASAPLLESGSERDLLQAVSFAMSESEARWMAEADKREADAGACLTAVIMQGHNIAVGNVGDCRAIHIAPDGTISQLTAEHRADDPAEEARITAEGGRVKNGYLNGVLQPSRTIGDRDEKRALRGGLSARPFTASMQRPPPPSIQDTQQSLSKTDKADLRKQALHLRKPPGAASAPAKKKGRKGGRQRSGSVSSTGASPLQSGLASAGDETPFGVLGVPDEFGLVALDDMQLTPAAPAAPPAAASSGGGDSAAPAAPQGATVAGKSAGGGSGQQPAHRIRTSQLEHGEWDSSDNETPPPPPPPTPPPPPPPAPHPAPPAPPPPRRRNKARKAPQAHVDGSGESALSTGAAPDVDAATAAAIAAAYRELNGGSNQHDASAGEWTTVTSKTGASQAVAREAAKGNAVVAPPSHMEPPCTTLQDSPVASPVPSEGTGGSDKARRRRQRQRQRKKSDKAGANLPAKQAAVSAEAAPLTQSAPPVPPAHAKQAPSAAAQGNTAQEAGPIVPSPAQEVPLSPLQRAVQGFRASGVIERGPCTAALPPQEEPDQLETLQQGECIWQLPRVSALVVASDGVWDTLGNDEAALIVSQVLQAHSSAEEAARTLVRSARSRGSEDDITALVLWFTPEGDEQGVVTM